MEYAQINKVKVRECKESGGFKYLFFSNKCLSFEWEFALKLLNANYGLVSCGVFLTDLVNDVAFIGCICSFFMCMC